MNYMTADEAREAFLKYFQDRDHLRLPSASLIPSGDPTLLLTTAGMVPFKPYFSRELEPPHPRITTVQKSFRTTDIEEVGDATHLTMFEMLGNFSFGDYFKKDAIQWGHDISLNVFQLEPERLFFTVYTDDDEAEQLWLDQGVDKNRIYRFGDADNWWGPAGDQGACGPSSELHYYTGEMDAMPDFSDPEVRKSWGPNLTDDFVEYYNLVFTQFNRDLEGNDTPLPFKNIDTGMGLERIVVILQGAGSIYEVDHFQPVVRHVEAMCGKKWGEDQRTTEAINIVAEHARSASFLIGDGVIPGNNGRGYVLRRVIRRGMLFARELGVEGPISEVGRVVAEVMGHTYPELRSNGSFIEQVLDKEEASFSRTLDQGTQRLHAVMSRSADITVSGADAAQLYDTYGFPVEMTQEVASENGLEVDMDEFEAEMEQRREKARSAGTAFAGNTEERKIYESLGIEETVFLGYNTLVADSTVIGIIKDGELLDSAAEGDEVEIVLEETPFYAARGGQIGDTGWLRSPGSDPEVQIKVNDTRAPFGHINVHFSKVMHGTVKTGDALTAEVDGERREKIRRNHTATHLVHAALREVLGSHVRQSGSVVAPEHLRFDFTHMAAMTPEEIRAVQDRVNEKIRNNRPVEVHWTTYGKAVEEGALAFFGDTYENDVRTIRIDPPWSYELCGGTHMESTGGIGTFIITSEAGIGSGVRRIFAVTGIGAEDAIYDRFGTVDTMSHLLKVPSDELQQRTQSLMDELAASRREVQKLEEQLLRASVAGSSGNGSNQKEFDFSLDGSDGVQINAQVKIVPASNVDSLRRTADHIRDQMKSGIVVLGSVIDERPMVVVMVTKDLTGDGLHAGNIAKAIAGKMGGGGGGSPVVAQAGGKEPDQLETALSSARDIVESTLAGETA